MSEVHDDPITREVEHQRELRERRQAWEQEQKQRKEQEERDAKRARLEAYLRRRGEVWMDTTGAQPPMHVLEQWQMDYEAEREAEYQKERAARLARAEAEYGF